ncbi:MFS transporter [Pseudooceanicola sp.]|uniref:MFS transporter n=1 Tax=Pseudooceanicola sp. TaxID=1914328 RepID=UPI002627BF5E|nr:MFS transporter [Pseudooceanicola sp.]MDF1854714.1 MFS transporter [Pseudooceanicola sp.]
MISNWIAERMARRGWHYGWVVVAVTFLTTLSTAGGMGAAGIMIPPLRAEFGWSTETISSAMALRLGLFGLVAPFAAALMARFGVRAVAMTATTMITIGVCGSIFMTEAWHLMLWWGVVAGTGTGMTALVMGATVATRWFGARRGLVVGVLTAANATGQLIFLPALAAISEAYGWRMALVGTMLAISAAFVLVALLMHDHPSDLGLAAFGETEVKPPAQMAKGLMPLIAAPFVVLRAASRTGTFWALFGTFFICGMSTNGLIQTHWVSICGDFGLLPVAAASILALIGVFDFIGTIGSGWLSDKFDSRWLLFWYYGLRGLSLVFLSYSGFLPIGLGIFAIFYGLDWIATVPPTVKLAAQRFGPEQAGMVFGWVFAGHQLGAATATWGAGAIRTATGTYMPALQTAGLLCLLAAMAILSVRRTPRPALGT